MSKASYATSKSLTLIDKWPWKATPVTVFKRDGYCFYVSEFSTASHLVMARGREAIDEYPDQLHDKLFAAAYLLHPFLVRGAALNWAKELLREGGRLLFYAFPIDYMMPEYGYSPLVDRDFNPGIPVRLPPARVFVGGGRTLLACYDSACLLPYAINLKAYYKRNECAKGETRVVVDGVDVRVIGHAVPIQVWDRMLAEHGTHVGLNLYAVGDSIFRAIWQD